MSKSGLRALSKCQRRIALRVAAAYRTVSGDALLVLTGIPPIDLLVARHTDVHNGRQAGGNARETKAEAYRKLMTEWQERWSTSERGAWTKHLIPEIAP